MRFSLYRFIHKPIRGQISQLYIQAGKAAYHDLRDVTALHEQTLRLSKFLYNHAMREDNFIRPELVNLVYPELAVVDEEHRTVDEKLKAVVAQIAKIREDVMEGKLSKEELTECGYEFYLTFGDFAGSYISHMITEERKIMPFLSAKLSHEQIFAMFMKQNDTVTNAEVIETIDLMYPYFSLEEAVKLTGMLKQSAGDDFPAMVMEIKKCLTPDVCGQIFKLSGVDDNSILAAHFSGPAAMFPANKKMKEDASGSIGQSYSFSKD